jgi:predicted nucleic acid-binding protein
MTKAFLDTNVFLDLFLDRGEFAEAAETILLWCKNDKLHGFTSTISISNIYYLLAQQKTKSETKKIIRSLLDFISVPVTIKKDLVLAIESSFNDFEDAIQYYSAMNIEGMDYIVTRNTKDFKMSTIAVVTSEEFVKKFA